MEFKISVLMPVYNGELYLSESIESVINQTFTNFEFVIVDDGSTDKTLSILKDAQKKDQRVKVYSLPHNKGIVEALNYGLSKCRAPFIARMDCDDIMHRDRLLFQHKLFLESPDTDVAGCLIEKFSSDNIKIGFKRYSDWLNSLCEHEDICREIFVESPFAHPSVMIKKDVFLAAGGYKDNGWPEDYDLFLRLFQADKKFKKVKQTLLYWRDEPGRLSRTGSRYSLENFYRCKAHYMANYILKCRKTVNIWGAKRRSRKFAGYLTEYGIKIHAYIDVDTKKVGNTIKGVPVILPERIDRKYPVLSYVSTFGARENIRRWLTDNQFMEGKDFFMMA